MATEYLLILSGALTGLLVGITGVGGGALMTPLLLLFFGIAPMQAVGTDLWFAAITKLFGGKVHHHYGLIDWQILKLMWLGSLTSAVITLLMIGYSGVDQVIATHIKTYIGLAIFITALGLFIQKYLHQLAKKIRIQQAERFKYWQPVLTVLAGAIIGILVTLTSVGAGALGAVALAYLYPLRLTPPKLIATDIVHAIPLAIFAGLGHLILGHVDYQLLVFMLLGSVPAVILGARLSAKLPHAILKGLLALVLLIISIKLLTVS